MTNSSINLAALGFGGIDTTSLVTSLVNLEKQPVTALQTKQTSIQSASSTISAFAATLSQLSGLASSLADPSTFASMAATSSDASVVATATGSPAAGNWSVSISKLAQEQRTMSNGTSDTSTALGLSGNLGITVGGKTATLALTASESLSDVTNAISQAGLPLQASTFYDGSQYHLMLSSTSTGAANAITFDESGLTGSGYSLGLSTPTNTIQQAQDANLTVGGVPITSPTNLVTNAIPGVSLALTKLTTTPISVTIASNTTAVSTQLQSFVSGYNALIAAGHADAGYGTATAANPLLQGDSAIRSSLNQMAQLAAEQVPGSTGAYTSLASVGLNLNADGTMSFDQTKFTAAMQADPVGVQKLFVTDANNGSTGVMGSITSAINSLTASNNGAISAELNSFASRNTQLNNQISSLQLQVTNYQTELQKEFTAMNTQLAQYKNESSALTQAFQTNTSSTNSVL